MVKKKSHFIHIIIASLLFFATGKVGLALDSLKTKTYHAKEIQVSAVAPNYMPSTPIRTLNDTTIYRLNIRNLADAIAFLSSELTVQDYGGAGGVKMVSFRTLPSTYTGVFFNGIPFNDYSSSQIDIGKYMLSQHEVITLSYGFSNSETPSVASLSSMASLHISSEKKDTAFHIGANVYYGMFDNASGGIQTSFSPTPKLFLSASGNGRYSLGNYTYPFAKDGSIIRVTRQNNEVKNGQASLLGEYIFSDSAKMKFNSFVVYTNRNLPGVVLTDNFENSKQNIETLDALFHLSHEMTFSNSIKFTMRGKYQYSSLQFQDPLTITPTNDFYFQNEGYLNASVSWKIIPVIRMYTSSDVSILALSSNKYAPTNPMRFQSLSAVGLVATYKNLDGELNGIFSLIKNSSSKKDTTYINLSPSVSIKYKLFDDIPFDVYAFYKQVFRTPTFNELYYQNIGTTTLHPELTHHFNLGVAYQERNLAFLDELSLKANSYYLITTNKITAIPKDAFAWSFYNIGIVETWGANVSLELALKKIFGVEISLAADYTFNYALNKTPSSPSFNMQIPYIPYHASNGRVSLRYSFASLNISYQYAGFRFFLPENIYTNLLPSYFLLHANLILSFCIADKYYMDGKIEVSNLFDVPYQVVRGFPMIGRTVGGTISFYMN